MFKRLHTKALINKSICYFFISTVLFFSSACSLSSNKQTIEVSNNYIKTKIKPVSEVSPLNKLYAKHDEWKGTPYVLGGLSKNGIDCSGFMYLTASEELGIELPRTTRAQALRGKRINKNDLQTGDLVFFKTGKKKINHVGIYLENGKFLHASTSKGVMISDINGIYWKETYWQSRRIIS